MGNVTIAQLKENWAQLSDADVRKLKETLKKRMLPKRLLDSLTMDENHPLAQTYDLCMASICENCTTIASVAKGFAQDWYWARVQFFPGTLVLFYPGGNKDPLPQSVCMAGGIVMYFVAL